MVNEKLNQVDFFSELKDTLSKWQEYVNKTEAQSKDRGFLFVSFDLSGSTVFKVERPQLWPYVVPAFYQEVLASFGVGNYAGTRLNCISVNYAVHTWKLWKLVGDEVLLYREITDIDELYPWVEKTYDIQQMLLDGLAVRVTSTMYSTAQSFRRANNLKPDFKKDIEQMRDILKSSLGIKTTMWIARCNDNPANQSTNLIYSTHTLAYEQFDFLGRDIDEGFRLASVTPKNTLIVSPLVAWLIYRHGLAKASKMARMDIKTLDSRYDEVLALRIISFMHLKDVWKNRKVPIIMFHPLFKPKEVEVERLKKELNVMLQKYRTPKVQSGMPVKLSDREQAYFRTPQRWFGLAYDDLDKPVFENIRGSRPENFLSCEEYKINQLDLILEDIHRLKESELFYAELSGI